jgi:hypothetical protein
MVISNSRKKSPLAYSDAPLSFSLVDYRNSYFTSDDPNKIIEFYNGFENRDQLMQWMRERPKGVATIHEIGGEKDIIVVIPTADFNGKYAKECSENIFKGVHIIFVESGEIPDPYFNYAHNCNVGIRKAMEYNPKWIVVSNDDMYKIDDIELLKTKLAQLENADIVYTGESTYHSSPMQIITPNYLFFLYLRLTSYGKVYVSICRRFNIRYFPIGVNLIKSLFFKSRLKYTELQSFMIISTNYIKRERYTIFDEIFINQAEDTDLSLRIEISGVKNMRINYQIGNYVGSTFGMNNDRRLRSLASLIYLGAKWGEKLVDS